MERACEDCGDTGPSVEIWDRDPEAIPEYLCDDCAIARTSGILEALVDLLGLKL